jgi:hypothetical protein
VPANLLQGGEIVFLAIKPSGWFVVLASLPLLASSAIVAGAVLGLQAYHESTPARTVVSLCAIVAVTRILLGCWQWLGRTYVLTNLRIVAVRGLLQVRWSAAALSEVRQAVLTATRPERLLGVGSIHCLVEPEGRPRVSWGTVARPAEVNQVVQEALRRARRMK